MITLQSDKLTFDFPEIAAALHRLVEDYVQKTLPRLLGEDREPAVSHLKSNYGYRYATPEERKAAEDCIRNATTGQIEAALRQRCREWARLEPLYGSDSIGNLSVAFQRTLRIPDDGKIYPLPAGLGAFPCGWWTTLKNPCPRRGSSGAA